jgi:hypothetical protein
LSQLEKYATRRVLGGGDSVFFSKQRQDSHEGSRFEISAVHLVLLRAAERCE